MTNETPAELHFLAGKTLQVVDASEVLADLQPGKRITLVRGDKLAEALTEKTEAETPAKPATVTEAELFNEALSSLRGVVRGEYRADPAWLEAITFQLQNAEYLAHVTKRAE